MTVIPTQTNAVAYARSTGRATPRRGVRHSAEELQTLDEALLRDLEEAAARAYSDEEPTPGWWNLSAARDEVADRLIARAARIARKAATR